MWELTAKIFLVMSQFAVKLVKAKIPAAKVNRICRSWRIFGNMKKWLKQCRCCRLERIISMTENTVWVEITT